MTTAVIGLSGCDLANNHTKLDRSTNLEMQDYRDAMAPREAELPAELENGVPELENYVMSDASEFAPMPIVSVSLNQNVPLRDALFEMAKEAGYDIELDPRISGSIIFTARNKPLDIVINRISEIAGLRYKFEDDTIRVELDTPYSKSYKIDYLNLMRESKSSMNTDVSVVSGEGADTGSSFGVTAEAKSDFWESLDENLAQILDSNSTQNTLRTDSDPSLNISQTTPPVIAPVSAESVGGDPNAELTADAFDAQRPTPVLRIQSLPSSAASANAVSFTPSFTINKQAGLVSIFANEKQHKEVQSYLTELKRSVSSQVLIEAKVLQVSLTDEFSAGIDWTKVGGFLSGELGLQFNTSGGSARAALSPPSSSNFSLSYSGNDLNAVVDAISRFGTVHALASPRLTVLNNQAAVLNVAENTVYFEIDIDTTTDEGVTQIETDSQIRTVPEGVLINVMPSIDLDTREISLSVRPTITRIEDFVEDPGVLLSAAQAEADGANVDGISSQVPIVSVQEMDSIISIPSGDVAILGGLLEDRTVSEENGVPVLGELPLFGSMFKNHNDRVQKTELIVFLKATIVNNAKDTIHNTDKDFYRMFSQDRRPLKL
ncbi:MAG: type II and III secretion system family protein [Pseudomonadota bacterium]|nr:type II and III secretion system family protein [Pseudomonadota bacterium]MED5422069.1 type II and III secretion system family protein [Pseudomonadota bacterium]